MISAFAKAVAQLWDPAFRRALWLSSAFSAAVLAVVGGAMWWLVDWLTPDWIPGWLRGWFFGWLIDLLIWIVGFTMAWLLFTALVSIFVGMFLEGVADAVEARHYPNDPPGKDLSIGRGLAVGLKFLWDVVRLNLIALPVYILLLLFVPVLNVFVFYGLNGYLLGREYFELVALRHLDSAAALDLRKRYRWRLFVAGVVMTFLFTVPVVNLVTPLVGTAAMVHIFKGLGAGERRTEAGTHPH